MQLRENERLSRTFYALHCFRGDTPNDGPLSLRDPGGIEHVEQIASRDRIGGGCRLASAFAAPAEAQSGVNVGNLTCNVSSGWGFVFGSSRALNCTFAGPGGRYEYYVGNIMKFGVDIGYTQGGVLIWTVIARPP